MHKNETGLLYVVATPIGNLLDMTLRAIEVLKKVDVIVAEDTRHSMPLLKHFSIVKPMISMHEFNEHERLSRVLDYLHKGESVALISDAGTPLISDPGYQLVRQVRAAGIGMVPVPGACALISALCVSGLPTDKFCYEGFLSAKTEARYQQLMRLRYEVRTMIFYEAPHRLVATLNSMQQVFGSHHQAVVARELTKIFETVLGGELCELIQHFEKHVDECRGEMVILLHGIDEAICERKEVVPAEVLAVLLEALPLKQAVVLTSKITGERKNELYELALSKKASS